VELLAESVNVDDPEPGAGMLAGVKLAVTPEGKPPAERAIAELNPPEMAAVIVEFPEPPGATMTEAGLADSEKPGAVPEPIVRLTPAVSFSPPPLPVMVMA
jgi:hypothetical protein